MQTCDRCIGTDKVLEEVIEMVSPVLNFVGYEVTYHKIEIKTVLLAKRYGFVSSPTIRVNETDIFGSVKENSCGSCSDISGTDINCRVFEVDGKSYEVPPKEVLAERIFRVIFGGRRSDGCGNPVYVLPENLKRFFEGKQRKSKCSCNADCC